MKRKSMSASGSDDGDSTEKRFTTRRRPANVTNQTGSFWTSSSRLSRIGLILSAILLACFAALLVRSPSDCDCPAGADRWPPYNTVYPLTAPVEQGGSVFWRVAVITDLDLESKSREEKNVWTSYFRRGNLELSHDRRSANVVWDAKSVALKSTLAQGGRSMELSDLTVFDGHLLTVDDRTGIVYKIEDDGRVIPWVVLADGDGSVSKGFKAEWMAVKDRQLFVGGLGKEWTTTTGEFRNFNPMWVKTVSHVGYVQHLDWQETYKKIRRSAGIEYPGYMIHESARWSDVQKRWFFLPRRASSKVYTEEQDERRATNYMLVADEDFANVQVRRVGQVNPIRGFSAFQFIPDTNDELIVALKSEESKGEIASYVTIFHVDGSIIMADTKLEGAFKFEGIEFV